MKSPIRPGSRFAPDDSTTLLPSKVFLLCALLIFGGVQSLYGQAPCACVSSVNFSIGGDCIDTIQPAAVLNDTAACAGADTIFLMDEAGNNLGNIIDITMVGQSFMYSVSSTAENNPCMGIINVMDERSPDIVCPPDTLLNCVANLDSLGVPEVIDCQDFTISMQDQIEFSDPCADTVEHIIRRFTAIDEDGNEAVCFQNIYLERPSLDSVSFPAGLSTPLTVSCTMMPDTSPGSTGFPLLEGDELTELTCNFIADYTDVIASTCGAAFKIRRTWRVTDLCSGESVDTFQIIDVIDTVGPEVSIVDTLRLFSSSSTCGVDVTLPSATVMDACGGDFDFQITSTEFPPLMTNGGPVGEIPVGMYTVTYRVTDGCNNATIERMTLIIQDNDPPHTRCKREVIIPLQSSGTSWIPAHSLDDGSSDNCNDVFFKARRITEAPACDTLNPNNDFADRIYFCCEDHLISPIRLRLRVYEVDPGPGLIDEDALPGTYSECTVLAIIQDKSRPSLVCPSDLTVSCTYEYNPDNLSALGVMRQSAAEIQEICIDDPASPLPSCQGTDGVAVDNCGVDVAEEIEIDIDMCQTGEIRRIFTATDIAGNESKCTQVIEVVNFDPFTINRADSQDPTDDIIWPRDYFTVSCGLEDIEPENLPDSSARPIILDDACDQIGMTSSDEVFDMNLSGTACAKILRTWRIMDWCQSENGEFVTWSYQQTIVVRNSTPPTITSSLDTESVCTDSEDCSPGFIGLTVTATDDCTPEEELEISYLIDLDSDGSIDDRGTGADASDIYRLGTHTVIWIIEDGCNNELRQPQTFQVLNCKKPTPFCHSGITTTLMALDTDSDGVPDQGMVEIWANDFDKGSFHVCGYKVTASFSADPSDVVRSFDCDDVGINDLELWITDENGQQDFCATTITIQNSQGIPDCDGLLEDETENALIAGTVNTADGRSFTEVQVELSGGATAPIMTDEEGDYTFEPMPLGGEYDINPSFEDTPRNGLSTADIIRVQKHLLGINKFDQADEYIAADVNASGTVSALDILYIRRLLLGDRLDFDDRAPWVFMDSSLEFNEPEDVLTQDLNGSYHIDELNRDMEVNFTAIKLGDLNRSYTLPGVLSTEDRTDEDLIMEVRDFQVRSDVETTVTYYLNVMDDLNGLQFALDFDPEELAVLDVSSSLPGFSTQTHVGHKLLSEGQLRMSWNGNLGESPTGIVEFHVTFRSKAKKQLSALLSLQQDELTAEAYDVNGQSYGLKINYIGKKDRNLVSSKFVPNPFTGSTDLNFYLNKKLNIDIRIFDGSGRLVYVHQMLGDMGANTLRIDGENFKSDGIYHCKISTRDEILTSKLMYIKK